VKKGESRKLAVFAKQAEPSYWLGASALRSPRSSTEAAILKARRNSAASRRQPPVQWRVRALEDGGFRVVPTLATSIRRRIHAFAG
jgi:hypothetical protein